MNIELNQKCLALAKEAVNLLNEKKLTVGCAESCTGGLLSGMITAVSGASSVFECGIVSYSERIKSLELGISSELIGNYEVVSREVAYAMAEGIINVSGCDLGIGITGIAGPSGGTPEQPVGTIYVSIKGNGKEITKNLKLYELGNFDRETNRLLAVSYALEFLISILKG